eukprot:Blabericola_migrator_1__4383@NODE_2352_length_2899_cov_335_533545_g1471_i0_p1_GENE_NODE_2352_length_2899_cov_335_533545_g1471_i0NODE_2352_length_2899_cov_335_533545_g1471_i0_p1_ORF_typecomplete_len485_score50_97Nucleoside_tran/PF01733_18/6_9e02Nucleoside_tran/PF01733_18/2_4e22_NODE_2352_length_2899_cov_335_533545_g1471_i011002554
MGTKLYDTPSPDTAAATPPNSLLRQLKGDLEVITSASCSVRQETQSESPLSENPVAQPALVTSGKLASYRDYIECTIIFGILGCLAGFFWEALLNCLPTICLHFFASQPTFSDNLTGVYNTAILLAAGILTFVSPLQKWILLSGTSVIAVCAILVSLLCTIKGQYQGATSIASLLIFVNFVAGIACGFCESSTFAYALCLHSNRFTGCFSVGFGLSGLISLGCWFIWSRLIWTEGDQKSAEYAIWAQQLVSAAIAFISLGAFIRFTHVESYKIWKAELPPTASITSSLLAVKPVEELEEAAESDLSLWEVIKATGTCQLHLGLTLYTSYVVVPNLVPMVLPDSNHQQDILVGIFQVLDFVGRMGANLDSYAPWIQLPQNLLVAFSYGRLALAAMAVRLIVNPYAFGMSNFGTQCLFVGVVALTNGWFLTLFMMYLGRPLTKDHDKGRATAVSVMTQLFGVVVGLYSASIAKTMFLPMREGPAPI